MIKPIQIQRDAIYTIDLASEVTGIRLETIRVAIKAKSIPAVKRGNQWFIAGDDLFNWLIQTDDSEQPNQEENNESKPKHNSQILITKKDDCAMARLLEIQQESIDRININSIPVFDVKVIDSNVSIFECPLCHKTNRHGIPEGTEHRGSHCHCWPNGYCIKKEN